MSSAYDQVLAKYNWAQKQISDLEIAVDAFRQSNPHSIKRCVDSITGEFVYRIGSIPFIPDKLAFMLGDAVHNLRSTLDHLAYTVTVANGGIPNSQTCFPIFDSGKAYTDMSRKKLPGLTPYILDAFDRLQPYRGGFGHWAWQLHRLDIVDKHRLLLTISTIPVGRSMLPSEKAAYQSRRSYVGPASHFIQQLLLAASAPRIPAVKVGDELARYPATEEYSNVGFAFDVAIDETGIVEGMPTFLFLRNVSDEVSKVIRDFASFL